MIFTPRDYQREIIEFIQGVARDNVFAGMGTGKTPSTLAAICPMLDFGEVRRVLVLAPKRVALTTWPDEVRKWENFQHLTIAAAVGTPEQRIAALASKAQIVTTNYDNVPWLIDVMGADWNFDMVVPDESARLKGLRLGTRISGTGKEFLQGQGARRARDLARVAFGKVRHWVNLTGSPAANGLQDLWGQNWFVDAGKRLGTRISSTGKEFLQGQGARRARDLARVAFGKVRHWVNLTGSPAANGLQDLWGQNWFVDAGKRLGTSFTAFQQRWFESITLEDGYSKLVPRAFAKAQIEAALRDVCITIDAKDHFDLPPLVESTVLVDLPANARRAYLELEHDYFTEIADHKFEVFSASTKSNKCRQFASGAAYTDDKGAWALVHDAKIDALRSVVTEASGMPVLVSYQFKSDCQRILRAFPRARYLDHRPETQAAWNRGEIDMLVAHPASAGHGLNLQHGSNILCDFSSGWNLEEDEQIIERIGPTRQAQSGLNRTVYRHRIVARDTIEENVILPVLARKAGLQDAFKNAMKRRQRG